MLLQEPKSVGLRPRFNPASDMPTTRRPGTRELGGQAERFLRDMAFALTLTHRVKNSIVAEQHAGAER
jgi:hypothetical protein